MAASGVSARQHSPFPSQVPMLSPFHLEPGPKGSRRWLFVFDNEPRRFPAHSVFFPTGRFSLATETNMLPRCKYVAAQGVLFLNFFPPGYLCRPSFLIGGSSHSLNFRNRGYSLVCPYGRFTCSAGFVSSRIVDRWRSGDLLGKEMFT